MLKFLEELKKRNDKDTFDEIIMMAEEDIKFNRVGFNKVTTKDDFIKICTICEYVANQCKVAEVC